MATSRDNDFYIQLLTSQYHSSPKAKAFLLAWIEKFRDATDALEDIDPAFDIDLAIGAQLDILGDIVGTSRTVAFVPNGIPGRSSILTDDEYRVLLKSKVGINMWKSVKGSLNDLWNAIFGGDYIGIQDRGDMSMDVYYSSTLAAIYKDFILYGYVVPRPQGVLVNYYCGDLPFVGFDYDNTFISGPGLGRWQEHCTPIQPVMGFDFCDNRISGFNLGWWDDSQGVGFTSAWIDYLESLFMATIERDIIGYDSLDRAMRITVTVDAIAETDGSFEDFEIDADTHGISGWKLYSVETTPDVPAPDNNLTLVLTNEINTEDKLMSAMAGNIPNTGGQTFYVWGGYPNPIISGVWTATLSGNTVSGGKLHLVFTFTQN